MFRHRMRRVGGHARHRHPQFPRRHQIHLIETRTTQGHMLHSHAGKFLQTSAVQLVIHKHTHRMTPRRRRRSFRREAEIMETELHARGSLRGLHHITVVRFRIVKGNDFHHPCILRHSRDLAPH